MINTLIPIIEGLPDPLDFKDEHHTWLSPLKLKSTASSHPEFIQLVDHFLEASKGTRKSNHVKTLRKHWELMLLTKPTSPLNPLSQFIDVYNSKISTKLGQIIK